MKLLWIYLILTAACSPNRASEPLPSSTKVITNVEIQKDLRPNSSSIEAVKRISPPSSEGRPERNGPMETLDSSKSSSNKGESEMAPNLQPIDPLKAQSPFEVFSISCERINNSLILICSALDGSGDSIGQYVDAASWSVIDKKGVSTKAAAIKISQSGKRKWAVTVREDIISILFENSPYKKTVETSLDIIPLHKRDVSSCDSDPRVNRTLTYLNDESCRIEMEGCIENLPCRYIK